LLPTTIQGTADAVIDTPLGFAFRSASALGANIQRAEAVSTTVRERAVTSNLAVCPSRELDCKT
jgi:hypothetical protein